MKERRERPRRSARQRILRALVAGSIGLVLTVLALELGLRWLLLGDGDLARSLGARMRQPQYFSDGDNDDDYWKLRHLFAGPDAKVAIPGPDPLLGWRGFGIAPETYRHPAEAGLDGRTPVLLYGDSFAQCNTPPEECFQAILAASDLAGDHLLVNYGVGGYGLDQIYLLLRHSIDLWVERDPIVVVSFLVESDLDRAILSFRDWPKPRLRVEDGALVSDGPVIADVNAYLEAHPLELTSFLARMLVFKQGALPASWQRRLQARFRRVEEKRALAAKLIEEIHRELDERGLRHFFLLFHAEGAIEPADWAEWQEPLVRATCAELGAPLISTRPFLVAAAGGDPGETGRFYGHAGKLFGHLNAVGNLVAFEALREGLAGRFEQPSTERAAVLLADPELRARFTVVSEQQMLGRRAALEVSGGGLCARYGPQHHPRVPDAEGVEHLYLRAGDLGPTRLRVALRPGESRFTAQVAAVREGVPPCGRGRVLLTVRADDAVVAEVAGPPAGERVELDLPLGEARLLELEVAYEGPGADCAWICLASPALR